MTGRIWKALAVGLMAAAGSGLAGVASAVAAAAPAPGAPASKAPAAAAPRAAEQATGDWAFTNLFTTLSTPAPRLAWELRLYCFSKSGCSADKGLSLAAGSSDGHSVWFKDSPSKTEPMVDSAGAAIGTCRATPAPSGSVTCVPGAAIKEPFGGWVGAKTLIVFAPFPKTDRGEPLAYTEWSDSPTNDNPGDNPANDGQDIVDDPAPNPLLTWIDPTAEAFAAGQAAEGEEVGVICESEGFCFAPAGTTMFAALQPTGVHFPYDRRTVLTFDGFDVAFRCIFSAAGSYAGPGTNLATCELESKAIVDHYGEAFVTLPVQAAAAAYPDPKTEYSLRVVPGTDMSGNPIGTQLRIVAPIAVTTESLPAATAASPYSASLQATGGVPTSTGPFSPPKLEYTWSLAKGSLPAGLELKDGTISGTPTGAGSTFTVAVTDGHGDVADRVLAIEVSS